MNTRIKSNGDSSAMTLEHFQDYSSRANRAATVRECQWPLRATKVRETRSEPRPSGNGPSRCLNGAGEARVYKIAETVLVVQFALLRREKAARDFRLIFLLTHRLS